MHNERPGIWHTDREREAECTSGATGAALRGLQRQWFWPWFWPLGSCLFLDTLKPPTNSRGGGDAFLTASETAAQAADSSQSSEKDNSAAESPAGATSAPLAATLAGSDKAIVFLFIMTNISLISYFNSHIFRIIHKNCIHTLFFPINKANFV